ncbi:MAG: hypothetical protein HY577_02645, partial [Candidatus Nealsonbacteria bacterium]|nr:hypothetical protein [Candidatus Nealsonbacteria bacterium]
MFCRRFSAAILLSVLFASLLAGLAFAQERVTLHFFYGSTCPHCQKAEIFLEKLKAKYPSLEIKSYEVFENAENARRLEKFLKEAGQDAAELRVPAIFVGQKLIIGYQDDEITGREIEQAIVDSPSPKTFKLPLIGEFDPRQISLPVLAVVIGLMDGFNPCAMWVLLLLISL